jgi:hypothetical protein
LEQLYQPGYHHESIETREIVIAKPKAALAVTGNQRLIVAESAVHAFASGRVDILPTRIQFIERCAR